MNIPNRASRNHARRSSRLVRESRHHWTSGLSLDGRENESLADSATSSAANSGPLEMKMAAAKMDFRRSLKQKSELMISAVIVAARPPCQSGQGVWLAAQSWFLSYRHIRSNRMTPCPNFVSLSQPASRRL